MQKYILAAVLALGASGAQAVTLSAPVPEPSTAVLMGLGLSGLSWAGRRRNRF